MYMFSQNKPTTVPRNRRWGIRKVAAAAAACVVAGFATMSNAASTGNIAQDFFSYETADDTDRLNILTSFFASTDIAGVCADPSDLLYSTTAYVNMTEVISFDNNILASSGLTEEQVLASLCTTRLGTSTSFTCETSEIVTTSAEDGTAKARLVLLSSAGTGSTEVTDFQTNALPAGDGTFLTAWGVNAGADFTGMVTPNTESGITGIELLFTDNDTVDPLPGTVLEQISDCIDARDSFGEAIVTGTASGALYTDSTLLDDLCYSRSCNGKGTCEPETGLCTCTQDGDGNWWWGIDCMTQCTCGENGSCALANCKCNFPYKGLQCAETSECATCSG